MNHPFGPGPWLPRHVKIETVFGCNASCVMCVVDKPTHRRKGLMPEPLYRRVVDQLAEHRDHIEKFDLFGVGEPLLDPGIMGRIAYARGKGIRRMAISTNADLLTGEKAEALLDTGIETVIFSLDGIRAETHEAIRRGVDFARVMANVERAVALRDRRDAPTRFVVRFIRQERNRSEWPEFQAHWEARLRPERDDLLIRYDMNTFGGSACSKDSILGTGRDPAVEAAPCHHLFGLMNVLNDGTVPLCCEDLLHARHAMGSLAENTVEEVFNSQRINGYRRMHLDGNKNRLEVCRECTVLYSEQRRVHCLTQPAPRATMEESA